VQFLQPHLASFNLLDPPISGFQKKATLKVNFLLLHLGLTALSFVTLSVIAGSMTLFYLTDQNQAKNIQRYQFNQKG
jgi:hypothetical protein